jgi:hypothetical protein
MHSPVTKSVSTRKSTALVISPAPPQRASGVASIVLAFSSGVRSGGARMGPGAMALTRISGARSSARLSVSAATAALET